MSSNGILLLFVCVTVKYLAIHAAHIHCDPNHPDHNTKDCPSPGEVDAAIANVELYYNDNLCEALKHVHCAHHHAPHDEKICGSDGVTYANHCLFAHARCKLVLDKDNYNHHTQILTLDVHNHGRCHAATAAPVQHTTAMPTAAPLQQSTAKPSSAPVQHSTAMHTAAPVQQSTTMTAIQTTTMAPPTTAMVMMTTTVSVHSIIQNVFCQHASVVDCSTETNILCASDKNFYPNDCELAKAKCNDPSLVNIDMLGLCTP